MIDTISISFPTVKHIFFALVYSMNNYLKSENSYLMKDDSDSSRSRYTTKLSSIGFLEIAFHFDSHHYYLKIKLQPIRLIDEGEIIDLVKAKDFNFIEKSFNYYMKDIFGDSFFKYSLQFDNWKLSRIDYAVNYYTEYVSQLMEILHKGNICTGFTYKDYEDSLYLTSDAVNINFYDKYAQLINKPYVDYSSIDPAKNILRFEVQCKSEEIYRLKKDLKLADLSIKTFWNASIVAYVIKNRIKAIIGSQNFLDINFAKSIIEKKYKKNYLTLFAILDNIQQSNNLQTAKETFLDSFPNCSPNKYDKYFVKIRKCKVNPITIPADFLYIDKIFPNPYNSIDSLILNF